MQGKNELSHILPSYKSCWPRIMMATDLKTQNHLAKLVGVTQSYISKLKQDDIFLPEWAYHISRKYDISMDWILTGINYASHDEKSDIDFFLEDLKGWMLSFDNDENKRKLFTIKHGKAFPEFQDWLENELLTRLDVDHLRDD